MKIAKLVTRTVGFQIFWLACVAGGNTYALIALLGLLLLFGFIDRRWPVARASLVWIAAIVIAGLLLEAAAVHAGGVSFRGEGLFGLPYWLLLLWLGFAFTFFDLYGGLFKHNCYLALVGALGGPLSYFAGAKLGAATLHFPSTMLLFWSCLWALVFFLLGRVNAIARQHQQ